MPTTFPMSSQEGGSLRGIAFTFDYLLEAQSLRAVLADGGSSPELLWLGAEVCLWEAAKPSWGRGRSLLLQFFVLLPSSWQFLPYEEYLCCFC